MRISSMFFIGGTALLLFAGAGCANYPPRRRVEPVVQCNTDRDCGESAGHCIENSCLNICGNGWLEPTEECDDGNLENEDGCNSRCAAEVLGIEF